MTPYSSFTGSNIARKDPGFVRVDGPELPWAHSPHGTHSEPCTEQTQKQSLVGGICVCVLPELCPWCLESLPPHLNLNVLTLDHFNVLLSSAYHFYG